MWSHLLVDREVSESAAGAEDDGPADHAGLLPDGPDEEAGERHDGALSHAPGWLDHHEV